MTSFSAVAAALTIGLATASADALPLFTLNFDGASISSNDQLTGAAGSVGFSFLDEAGDVRVSLDIKNTTGDAPFGAGATSSKLTGFGFDLLSGVSFIDGTYQGSSFFSDLLLDAKFKPFDALGLAVADNDNFLGGNANGALPQGQATSVSFRLATTLTAVELGDAMQNAFFVDSVRAGMRFQQVNAGEGSDKLIYVGSTPSLPGVPVPAALPLMASGLALFGLLGRRARNRVRAA